MQKFTVNAGDMRTQITLQVPTTTKDAGAAQVPSYANAPTNPTVWARWVNAHGVEAVTSEALKNVQRAAVTIRYRSDVAPTWQVLKNNEAWQVISVDHVQDKQRYLELIVERAKGSL